MTGSSDLELAMRFYAAFIRIADGVMTESTVYLPGARALLRKLYESHKPRAVVTTKLARRIIDFFTCQKEPELVDFVIGYDEVKAQKPAPDGLLTACERFARNSGINMTGVVYVGDNSVDAEAAAVAGVDFIGVTSGTTAREVLEGYPHVAVLGGVDELVSKI
jgi:phosphoglycolate phosphatase